MPILNFEEGLQVQIARIGQVTSLILPNWPQPNLGTAQCASYLELENIYGQLLIASLHHDAASGQLPTANHWFGGSTSPEQEKHKVLPQQNLFWDLTSEAGLEIAQLCFKEDIQESQKYLKEEQRHGIE